MGRRCRLRYRKIPPDVLPGKNIGTLF